MTVVLSVLGAEDESRRDFVSPDSGGVVSCSVGTMDWTVLAVGRPWPGCLKRPKLIDFLCGWRLQEMV